MKRGYASIGVIVVIALILLVHVSYLRFVCDDAFISFRYAKNFVEGHGLVYNIGERVEGYSNFLWTLLLSLFMKIGLDPVIVSQILGVLFSLATVFLLIRFSRRLYPSENLFNYLAPLFLACCGSYAAWSTGGLETTFFTFLVFLGSFLIIEGVDQPKLVAYSGFTFAFVCMTRLDGLIFVSVTFIFLLYLWIFSKRIDVKSIGLWSLFFLIPFLLYFFWRWSYYGQFLPNTFYVKVGNESLYRQGLLYLFNFMQRFWIWLLVIPLIFLVKLIRLNTSSKIITPYFASMILVFSLYVVYVGGDFMDMFRFFVPILPFFFFLIQEGFRGMYSYLQSLSKRKHKVVPFTLEILLIGLSVCLLAYPSKESNKSWEREGIDSIGLLREYAHLWSKAGLMFRGVAKPGESLSTTAAGAIPFYSELYAIDELGLTLPSQSDLVTRSVSKPGHRGIVTDEFLLSVRPTYILGHPKIYNEYQRARGQWGASEILSRNGYTAGFFTVTISEEEDRYLYCLTSKESLLDKSQHVVPEMEEAKPKR